MRMIILTICVLIGLSLKADPVYLKIRIYSHSEIERVEIQIMAGIYDLYRGDSLITTLNAGNSLSLHITEKQIKVKQQDSLVGAFPELGIIARMDKQNGIRVRINNYSYSRVYDDHLIVLPDDSCLVLINQLDLEDYVAGVAEAEAGGLKASSGFYEVQSIIARTYALNNIMKHYKEGYNLCDDVHCQVYRGRSVNDSIIKGVANSKGLVIVDKNDHMISAAFHSNSGGHTIDSEDIWAISTNYLKGKPDSFSVDMPNFRWVAKMPEAEWLKYLHTKYGYPVFDSQKRKEALFFEQSERRIFFHDSIPLKYIRRDLDLKSTYFSVVCKDEIVYLNGRGYGHGVGLSQEGALRMNQLGYTTEETIQFYYKGVHLQFFYEVLKKN